MDWEQVHVRIARAQAALEREFQPDAAQVQRVLRARARALAIRPSAAPGATIDVVTFVLARETYGIETKWVRQVSLLKGLTALPGTPPFVLGIMNLRGQVLSVVDLKQLFELPPQGLGDLNRVLVLASREIEFGILADVVLGLRPVVERTLAPALPTLTGPRANYIKGITPDGEIILDGERLLSDPHLVVRD